VERESRGVGAFAVTCAELSSEEKMAGLAEAACGAAGCVAGEHRDQPQRFGGCDVCMPRWCVGLVGSSGTISKMEFYA
jgi:hypothetical protein